MKNINKFIRPILFVSLLGTISNPISATAASLDFNIHSEAMRATYAKGLLPKFVSDIGAIILDNNRSDDIGVHTGIYFNVNGNIRIGMRGFYIAPGTTDLLAVGFGGRGKFPLNKQLGLAGHFYYAPESLSFMDSAGYREFGLRLNFKVAKLVALYLGYRNLKVEVFNRNNSVELDDDFHVGMMVYF